MKKLALFIFILTSFAMPSAEAKPSLIDPQSLNGKWVGTVAYTTEYLSRGISNATAGVGAAQAGLEFDHNSGVHVGVWGSSIAYPPPDSSANIELDYSAGYRNVDDAASYDLFATYYTYPRARRADGLDFDYVEFTAQGAYDFGVAKPHFALNYSPYYQFESGMEWYADSGVDVPLGRYVTALLHAGYSTFERPIRAESHDYWDFSVGLGTNVGGLDFVLAYVTTTLRQSECIGACDRFVLTVSKTF
jgi:uncharacterized protein (TIGR02001 family)